MTIAEQLEELGRRKGFRQGRNEGRHEGRQEGRLQGREEGQKAEALRIASEMLRSGMDKAVVQRLTGLSDAALAQLKH